MILKGLNSNLQLTEEELSTKIPYEPPVDPNSFGKYAFFLIAGGFYFLSLFVIDLLAPNKKDQSVFKQIIFSAIASTLIGMGIIFTIMECGVFIWEVNGSHS